MIHDISSLIYRDVCLSTRLHFVDNWLDSSINVYFIIIEEKWVLGVVSPLFFFGIPSSLLIMIDIIEESRLEVPPCLFVPHWVGESTDLSETQDLL